MNSALPVSRFILSLIRFTRLKRRLQRRLISGMKFETLPQSVLALLMILRVMFAVSRIEAERPVFPGCRPGREAAAPDASSGRQPAIPKGAVINENPWRPSRRAGLILNCSAVSGQGCAAGQPWPA
jgi:hypothetical protein